MKLGKDFIRQFILKCDVKSLFFLKSAINKKIAKDNQLDESDILQ